VIVVESPFVVLCSFAGNGLPGVRLASVGLTIFGERVAPFFATAFAGAFLATTFFTGAFLAGAFFATIFLATFFVVFPELEVLFFATAPPV
jgi:hypothetical protein